MKVAIVTGGGSGIGRAVALELAKENYAVAVADIEETKAQQVAAAIEKEGGEAIALQVDIKVESAIQAMVENTYQRFGRLNVLVNNAGINFTHSVEDCTVEEFDECIAVNFRGHYLASKYSILYLKEEENNAIIHISSTHAMRTQPRFFPYNASKSAILAMTRSMAIDLSKHRIRVNAICPGFIKTNILSPEIYEEDGAYMKKIMKYHPSGRVGNPEDVAYAVAFLVSDKAAFINGETLVIDGGRSALTYDMGGNDD
ncbi:SDR family oxidoreductase [Alkalihalobacillus oceani]|uniref:SDR family NAD(P)-dependent oxidoreductase n=1 Tax=Halalkalibacter oceani TaxID=1653776 RepID=UPI00203F5BBF|nr:SDR family oxidoreductase [Halalkalibacter oceani]MCM3763111.1 SDR family oxidoreductase [Halalkalibacter oceani]